MKRKWTLVQKSSATQRYRQCPHTDTDTERKIQKDKIRSFEIENVTYLRSHVFSESHVRIKKSAYERWKPLGRFEQGSIYKVHRADEWYVPNPPANGEQKKMVEGKTKTKKSRWWRYPKANKVPPLCPPRFPFFFFERLATLFSSNFESDEEQSHEMREWYGRTERKRIIDQVTSSPGKVMSPPGCRSHLDRISRPRNRQRELVDPAF